MFGAIGQVEVESAQIVTDRDTGRSKGFAFDRWRTKPLRRKQSRNSMERKSPDVRLLLTKHGRWRKVTSGTAAVVAAADAGIKYVQTIPPPFRLAIPGIR
jgi:hypothetical protein